MGKKQMQPKKLRTVAPGVYVLENGLYEVWHCGHYVARVKTETEAIALKETAKESKDYKAAVELNRQRKLRKQFQKKVEEVKSRTFGFERPESDKERLLINENPQTFEVAEMLESVLENGELPLTFEEWSKKQPGTTCTLLSFAKVGTVLSKEKLEELYQTGAKDDIRVALDLENLEKHLVEVRDEWVKKILKAAEDCVRGWGSDEGRYRDLPRAQELIELVSQYFAPSEMAEYRKFYEGEVNES